MAYTRRNTRSRSGYSPRRVQSVNRRTRSSNRSYGTRKRTYRSAPRTRDVRLVIEQVAPQPAITMEGLAAQGRLQGITPNKRSVF